MSYLLYLMFRCDFDVMESLEEWEGTKHSPSLVRWGRNWCLAWGLPVTTRHIGGALRLDWATGAIQPSRDEEIGKMRKNRRKRNKF